jgi:hypothetical protein
LNEAISWAVRTGQPIDLRRIPDSDFYRELERRGGLNLAAMRTEALRAELLRRQVDLRFDLSELDDGVLYREIGRRRQAKRKVHRGGPGRPRKPRCPCGRFTQDDAQRKRHVCGSAEASARTR